MFSLRVVMEFYRNSKSLTYFYWILNIRKSRLVKTDIRICIIKNQKGCSENVGTLCFSISFVFVIFYLKKYYNKIHNSYFISEIICLCHLYVVSSNIFYFLKISFYQNNGVARSEFCTRTAKYPGPALPHAYLLTTKVIHK